MATVQYDAKTGNKLSAGQSTTDALGNTFKSGDTYAPKNTGSGSNAKVLFDAKTGNLLDKGANTTDAMGNTFKQGQNFSSVPNIKMDSPNQPAPSTIPNTDAKTGAPLAPGASTVDALGNTSVQGNKFKNAFQQTAASGTPTPPTMGEANATISNTVVPPPPDTSGIDTALANDKGYQTLLADQKKYDDVTQHETLLKTYDAMLKKAGIPSIDKKLLNTQKIIDGTEDDIRKEVQAVSGFATDSQVLALSSARNKTLIQNYNNLLATKQVAMDNIKTMIGLAQTDQQTASQNALNKIGIDEKLMTYRDKFITNATEGYNNVIKAVGYDGLYKSLVASGDSSAIGLAERTLGLAPNQLKTLASQPNLDTQLKKAQLYNLQLDSQKKKSELSTGSNVNNPQYAGIISTILGSGKFTKDQSNAITKAINNGEDPFTVIKNNAKNIAGQTEATKITSYETAKSTMDDLNSALKDYYSAGGKTDVLKGNYEKVVNKLGEVSDPKLVELATQISAALQVYRNAISGTAYSVQEGADISSIFPGINKSEGLNTAIINGRKKAFDSVIDGSYRSVLGNEYDTLKQTNSSPTSITPEHLSNSTVSGLTVTIPGIGTWTAPDQKSLEAFKKDHGIQ